MCAKRTAISLAEAVVEGKRLGGRLKGLTELLSHDATRPSAVQVSAGRGGGVFGDHSLFFLGEHERIELSHSALNRSVFASVALRAALWCIGRAPGFYHMEDLWERIDEARAVERYARSWWDPTRRPLFCLYACLAMTLSSSWSDRIFDVSVNRLFSGQIRWERLSWGPYPWDIRIKDPRLVDAQSIEVARFKSLRRSRL